MSISYVKFFVCTNKVGPDGTGRHRTAPHRQNKALSVMRVINILIEVSLHQVQLVDDCSV